MTIFARNSILALLIAGVITGTIAFAITYLNNARVAELSAIEAKLSIDTLSIDTQFSLLAATPCDSAASTTMLAGELSDLGTRLSFAEEQLGTNNEQVIRLKERYSLLEIRDYLLTKQLATACGIKPVTVLYFYSNAGDCSECDKAGYALSYLRKTYPALRVYSFDYNLDLGALKTLIAVTKIDNTLPAFVIDGKRYYGFTSLADLEKQFPKGSLASTTAAIRD